MADRYNGMFGDFAMEVVSSLRVMVDVLQALMNGERDTTQGALRSIDQPQFEALLEVLAERERSDSFRALFDRFMDPETVRSDNSLLVIAGLLDIHVPEPQVCVFVEAPVISQDEPVPKVGDIRKLKARAVAAGRSPLPSSRSGPSTVPGSRKALPSSRFRPRRSPDNEDESDEDENTADSEEDTPPKKRRRTQNKKERDPVNPDSKRGPYPSTPKKIPGSLPVPDQDIDRTFARRGKPDPSKYTIVIKYQKTEKDGKVVPAKTVKYSYLNKHNEPKWDSSETLKCLNQWRSQVMKRAFGTVGPPKKMWLKSEQKIILDLMRKQFERKNAIKWKRLANSYNNLLKGKIQSKGEELISTNATKTNNLNTDRVPPWRTSTSIKAMAPKWAEYNEMQAEANRKQQIIDEAEEIPVSDSDDDPVEKDPGQASRATAGHGLGNGVGASEEVAGSSDRESGEDLEEVLSDVEGSVSDDDENDEGQSPKKDRMRE
ncbi:hypothetical protein IFR05_008652 [Cadophora sp. M221]|nr:hypothetical protein IFR05_008652 [Cadophora sp. M221]